MTTVRCPGRARIYFRRTCSVTAVVCASEPDVPEIVSVKVPVFVVEDVATLSVDVEEVGFGENDAVEPAGRPLTVSVTALLNPFEGVIEMAYDVLPPRTTDWLAGEATSEKSAAGGGGGWLTTSVEVVECVVPPAAPVIVSG